MKWEDDEQNNQIHALRTIGRLGKEVTAEIETGDVMHQGPCMQRDATSTQHAE